MSELTIEERVAVLESLVGQMLKREAREFKATNPEPRQAGEPAATKSRDELKADIVAQIKTHYLEARSPIPFRALTLRYQRVMKSDELQALIAELSDIEAADMIVRFATRRGGHMYVAADDFVEVDDRTKASWVRTFGLIIPGFEPPKVKPKNRYF